MAHTTQLRTTLIHALPAQAGTFSQASAHRSTSALSSEGAEQIADGLSAPPWADSYVLYAKDPWLQLERHRSDMFKQPASDVHEQSQRSGIGAR